MDTAVVGSRSLARIITAKQAAFDNLDACLRTWNEITVVSGGADGPDDWSVEWARLRNQPTPIIYYPDWDTHGRRAGYIRNVQIITRATVVIAFWDGYSRGTGHDIQLAREQGKRLYIRTWDPEARIFRRGQT